METMDMLKTPDRKITIEEIAELEEPIKNIIEKIQERIERGEYGIIIGDDTSGRIPALILGGFIKRISKLRNLPEPNVIFIPGKLNEPQNTEILEKLKKHLDKYRVKNEERILIVTEAVQSGHALKVISDLLKKLNFEVDIATMGIEGTTLSVNNKAREKNLGDSNLVSGDYIRRGIYGESHTPLVYGQGKIINGVYKKTGDSKSKSVAKSYKNPDNNSSKHKIEIQEKINKSREEVNILVDKLVDWYLTQNK